MQHCYAVIDHCVAVLHYLPRFCRAKPCCLGLQIFDLYAHCLYKSSYKSSICTCKPLQATFFQGSKALHFFSKFFSPLSFLPSVKSLYPNPLLAKLPPKVTNLLTNRKFVLVNPTVCTCKGFLFYLR